MFPFQDLCESEEQYNLCLRSQIENIGLLHRVSLSRVADLLVVHHGEVGRLEKSHQAGSAESAVAHAERIRYLQDVRIASKQRHNDFVEVIRREYQFQTEDVRNKVGVFFGFSKLCTRSLSRFCNILAQNLEEKQTLQLNLEEQMDQLWRKLQNDAIGYQNGTEEKRRIYSELLVKDNRGVAEVQENSLKIAKLTVRSTPCVLLFFIILTRIFVRRMTRKN